MTKTKSIFKSKTMIANAVGLLMIALSHWGVVVPEGLEVEIGASLPLINLVLRMVTKDKVTLF